MEISNAIIDKVFIGIERGHLTWWIHLEDEFGSQNFGGYSLIPEYVESILKVASVSSWGDLLGQTIRVERKQRYDSITGIGHIFRNVWFRPGGNPFEGSPTWVKGKKSGPR